MKLKIYLLLLLLISGLSVDDTFAASTTNQFVYMGRVVKPNGKALNSGVTTFTIEFRSPDSNNCLLWKEQQQVDMTDSQGTFNLYLGDTANRTDAGPYSFTQIFTNSQQFVVGTCTYIPTNNFDSRKVVLKFDDGSGEIALPAEMVGSVPYAQQANYVSGYSINDLVKISSVSDSTAKTISSSGFSELIALISGSSTQYTKSGQLGSSPIPSGLTSGESIRWNTGLNAGNGGWEKFTPGSAAAVTSVGLVAPAEMTVANSPISSSGNLTLGWASQSANTIFAGPGSGGAAAPAFRSLAAADIPNLDASKISTGVIPNSQTTASTLNTNNTLVLRDASGNFSSNISTLNGLKLFDGISGYVTLQTATPSSASYTLKFPNSAGASGEVLTTDGSGVLSWSAMASSTPSGTAGGDLSGTYPNPTVAKISGVGISFNTVTSGNFLKYNGTNWINSTPSSADLSDASSLLTSSQMPANCTANQTLTFSSPTGTWACSNITITGGAFGSQAQNAFLSGPSTGGAGAATFRAIANADLPSGVIGTPGVYKSVTVDTYGRVTAGTNPTTVAGYGITDAVQSATLPLVVTSGNVDLTIGAGLKLEAVTSKLVPDFGTASGKVAQGDDTRFLIAQYIQNNGIPGCASGVSTVWNGTALVCSTTATNLQFNPSTMTGLDVPNPPAYSNCKNLTLTNIGTATTAALVISITSGNDSFSLSNCTDSCTGVTLAAGASCVVGVRGTMTGQGIAANFPIAGQIQATESGSAIATANLSGTVSADLCYSGSPALGTLCTGGGIYAGIYNGNRYMIMPSGCSSSTTDPICSGTDALLGLTTITSITATDNLAVETVAATATVSTMFGDQATAAIIAAGGGATPAASYCADMSFGNYTDWYVPAKSEMSYISCHSTNFASSASIPQDMPACTDVGGKTGELTGFAGSAHYWTSTERDANNMWVISSSSVALTVRLKSATTDIRVRCIRRY